MTGTSPHADERAKAEADMIAFLDAELEHIKRRRIDTMVPRGHEVAEMRRAILTGRYRRAP